MRRSGESVRSRPTIGFEASDPVDAQSLARRREAARARRDVGAGRGVGACPLERGTRFRIVLEDDDSPRPNELIGAVDIAYGALVAALSNDGAVHRVDVGDQGQPIDYVGIRVMRE